MRISTVEIFQIIDIAGTERGCHLSKLFLDRIFLAEIHKQITTFSPYAASLPSQITYINTSFLFQRPCYMLEMKIAKSFFNGQDEPDRRSAQLHEMSTHEPV
jgi:hypothetical protein